MDEKKYTTNGTVTISTDEYRDLITDAIKTQQEASETRSRLWAAQNDRDLIKKELDETTLELEQKVEKLNIVNEFLASKGLIETWQLYYLSKKNNDEA